MSFVKTFDVSFEEAFALLDEIDIKVSTEGKQAALDELARAGEIIMRSETPWDDRGRGAKHLRESVKTVRVDDDTRDVFPDKTVDGIPLGNMIERGSTNQRIITPKKGRFLRFFWNKTGKFHLARKVKRGIIPPNPFISRTAKLTTRIAPTVALDAIKRTIESVRVV